MRLRIPILQIILIVVAFLIIIGCAEDIAEDIAEDAAEENLEIKIRENTAEELITGQSEEQEQELMEENLPEGVCREGWKCISSNVKAYQRANCSFGERKNCQLGCENNTCRVRESCTVGFKCKSQYIRGYRLESCDWISTTRCEFGCLNAKCLPEPEAGETETGTNGEDAVGGEESGDETAEAPAPALILNEGEIIDVNGQDLSIYLLEPERVKIRINAQRSNWLAEGESYTGSGVKITIVGILYQSYQGGTRAVEYEVG